MLTYLGALIAVLVLIFAVLGAAGLAGVDHLTFVLIGALALALLLGTTAVYWPRPRV